MPVPAPTSATLAPLRDRPARSSTASKRAGGYEGRLAAYCAAAALKEWARAECRGAPGGAEGEGDEEGVMGS